MNSLLSLAYLSYLLQQLKGKEKNALVVALQKNIHDVRSCITKAQLLLMSAQRQVLDEEAVNEIVTTFLHLPQSSVIPFFCSSYPLLLRQTDDFPLVLYVKGKNIELLNNYSSLAVVGSRSADPVGEYFAFEWAKNLAHNNVVIVSGLALGIDAAAHRGSLESQAVIPTVAVLGNGINYLYPRQNKQLTYSILEKGGIIISEFLPTEHPRPHFFLQRNRIIAGITKASLVIQAAIKSGALSTARFANEYGRSVGVLPFQPLNSHYHGNLHLLREGATPISSEGDIYDLLSIKQGSDQKNKKPREFSSKIANDLYRLLKKQKVSHITDLQKYHSSTSSFLEILFDFELEGLVERRDDGFILFRG